MESAGSTYRPVSSAPPPGEKAFRLLISGGGTGGHVFPAIAIADTARKILPETEIFFIGARDRLEMDRVPRAGYPIEGLWISGFQRSWSLRNLLFPVKLLSSLIRAGRLLRRFRPDVVVGVGGYASGPTLYMAQRRGIPTLVQEQNSFPGITNRLLGKKADRICVAYEGMDRFFPADRIRLTGNPVRQDLAGPLPDPALAKEKLGLDPGKPLVVLIGGSLGARSLNEAMAASYERIGERSDIQMIWQVGRLYEKDYRKSRTAGLPQVDMRAFLEEMPLIYAAAEVVVCRAGALTLSELCLIGKAAVLVPSPNVAEDHQTKNARALSDQGAALLVPDREAAERMLAEAFALVDDPVRRKALEEKARRLGRADAGRDIVNEILKLGGQST